MTDGIRSETARTTLLSRWLPALTAGLVAGIIAIVVEISFAALIYSGDLAGHVSSGIGFALAGGVVITAIVALTSSFPGALAIPQDTPAAILALVAVAIVHAMPPSSSRDSVYLTVVAAITTTSLVTGAAFLALGRFKLGGLVRYMPYPVVGGFLAGTGWVLAKGALGVMSDVPLTLAGLPELFRGETLAQWLPGVVFGVLLLIILRYRSHFLIVPAMLLAAIVLFYFALMLTGISVAAAGAKGWLLGPFPPGSLLQIPPLAAFGQVNWWVIGGQAGSIGTIVLISVVSALLNVSGVELEVRQDIDSNRELESAGFANCAAALVASSVGYQTLSLSMLGYKIGSSHRLNGLVAALLAGVTLVFGGSVLSLFPRFVLGGLLFYLGLSFLVDWVYDAWSRLAREEYAILVIILLTMSTLGVLQGVGLGLGLAMVMFVVEYSRAGAIRHTMSGANFRSRVDRPRFEQEQLNQKGDELYILQLQGFIFFGTANRLVERVRRRIDAPSVPAPRFVVLDFEQVSGQDASAIMSFTRMKHLTQAHQMTLVFTQISERMRRRLAEEVFAPGDAALWRVFPDLDRGVEWCEQQVLIENAPALRSVEHHLTELLTSWDAAAAGMPDVSRLIKYLERSEVAEGEHLIRHGDAPRALYFVETGQVTAQLERADGQVLRVRKMGAGTVVGELGMYLGSAASTSVIADAPTVVYALSLENMRRMERDDPAIAAAFHRSIARLVGEKMANNNFTLRALLEHPGEP